MTGLTPQRVRVMIVEDDHEMLDRLVGFVVGDERMSLVGRFGNGRDAIARMTEAKPDVLMVDLGLPDIHGLDVIRSARSRLPDCDIMVITVFGDDRSVLASIEAGASGYLLKDVNQYELVHDILELRAGGAPMSPGIARLVLNRMRVQENGATGRPHSGNRESVLTEREIDVLSLLARGYSYGEVAGRLNITLHTVNSHIKNSYRKLEVHSGAAAVTRASELGLLRRPGENGGKR